MNRLFVTSTGELRGLVAVIFAFSQPIADVENPLFYMWTAILVAMLLGFAFVRTGSLWSGIGLHAAWNYLQIAIFAIPNGVDERIAGARLFVFERLAGRPHMLVEPGMILDVPLFFIWSTRPRQKDIAVTTG